MQTSLIDNLQEGIYLLFLHNADLLAYVTGIIICGALTFLRPSRLSLLFTLGFIVLAFSFEYDKHIIGPLREQTLATVVGNSTAPHFTIRKTINLFFSVFLPFAFFVTGWVIIFSGIIYSMLKSGKKAKES